MKKIIKTISVYIGFLIGAGFASGREILEYFNLKSNTNILGIIIASFLFIIISYVIMSKSSDDKIYDYSSYIESVSGKRAFFVKIFMMIYMFCGMFVMFAGSGALVYDVSSLSEIAGAVLMALICFIVMSFDLRGIVAINIILVPLMVCGILYVSFCVAIFGESLTFSQYNILGENAILSAICYSAYNTLTAGVVLVPLAVNMKKREICISSIISGFIIGLLIMVVWVVQGTNFGAIWESDLPMLELAALCSKTCKRVYTVVLFMSICTTAVSYGFGLMSYFSGKFKNTKDRVFFAAIICLAALPPALYGFSNLVAYLYSFFGYAGMIWMVWIIIDKYK